MASDWIDRVEHYLNELDQLAKDLDARLKSMSLETNELRASDVLQSNAVLMQQLSSMEAKIAQRQDLLDDADAPSLGSSLTDKLQHHSIASRRGLGERCRQISSEIAMINQRAVSLFVCQFHLSQLSTDIVRIIAGATAPPTYGAPNQVEKRTDLGGGLFNKAA